MNRFKEEAYVACLNAESHPVRTEEKSVFQTILRL
jgi:hypothetical protein